MVDLNAALRARYIIARDHLLAPLRRGGRVVHTTPNSGIGFGNFLYLWLHAYVKTSHDIECRVLTQPAMEPWLDELPKLRSRLAILEGELRFEDRREPWTMDLWARFGIDFDRPQLHSFIREMLLAAPLLNGPRCHPEVTTVNVRRGDYYSKPHFRGTYGFDIAEYLEVALQVARRDGGDLETIQIVSDDVTWCRTKLNKILSSNANHVAFVADSATPRDHFRSVATSRRIVGTNSTFSYWAGYVSNVLFGQSSQVIMPSFHARLGDDFRAYQLDPEWTIIEDIPGGWDG